AEPNSPQQPTVHCYRVRMSPSPVCNIRRFDSEDTVLAAIVGLARSDWNQCLFSGSERDILLCFLFGWPAQGYDLHTNHRLTIFVIHSAGNDSSRRHAEQDIADLLSVLKSQYCPGIASLRLILLVHKTGAGSAEPV